MRPLELVIILVAISSVASAVDQQQIFENLRNLNLKSSFNVTEESLDVSNLYLNFICAQDIASKNISEVCASQMEIVCNNTEVLSYMADAWSKFPYAGMLTASRQEWGAFDQCVAIDYQPEAGPRILGKHCANGLAIPENLNFETFYLLSYCVPDGCSALDVARFITIDPLPETIVTELVNDIFCSTKETNRTLDGSSIAVATLFCTVLALVVVSTLYETCLHQKNKKNKIPILTAFSVLTNGQKLAQTTHTASGDQILVFHGIKVISMMWILAGHAAGVFSILPVTNRDEMDKFEYQRHAQYIVTAHLAVDTFFFISGFLLAYQYFKGPAKKPVIVQIMSIPKMIIHRYLRITPVVLMFFLYSMYLSKHIGNGPLFDAVHDNFNNPCKKHWWAVFLYIQNYWNPTDMCWVHLWYLSADWQLFLIAPFILIPMAWQFRRRFNAVMISMVILNIFFLLLPLYTKLRFPNYDPDHLEYEAHSKLVTYFMGVMFGFYFRCRREQVYIFRKGLNVIMWIFSLLLLFGATVILHEVNINHESHTTKSLCDVFIKPVWCLGLVFVIYSCTCGYGGIPKAQGTELKKIKPIQSIFCILGIVNWLLTAGWIQVISKLTYCMYIMHLPVIVFWLSIKRTRDHFSDFNLFFYWCGHFILSLIVSTIWTLMFESPLITIERILLGGGKPRAAKDDLPKDKIIIIHKEPIENGTAA